MIERGAALAALVTAAVLGLLIGILVGVGIAKAAPFTPELEADYAYAEQWWGAVPASCSSVTREVVPTAEIGGNVGMATQPNGEWVGKCRMRVADDVPPCALREVVLHEYGHLLGLGHSTNPASIMYPVSGTRDCEREALGQRVAELGVAVASIEARCRAKVRPRPRRLCHRNALSWQGELVEIEAELDGVQEPLR